MEFPQGVCAFRWCFIPNSLAWAVLVQTLYSRGDSGSVKVLISHTVTFFLSPSPKQVTSHHTPKGWNRPHLSVKSGRVISQNGVGTQKGGTNYQLPEKQVCLYWSSAFEQHGAFHPWVGVFFFFFCNSGRNTCMIFLQFQILTEVRHITTREWQGLGGNHSNWEFVPHGKGQMLLSPAFGCHVKMGVRCF